MPQPSAAGMLLVPALLLGSRVPDGAGQLNRISRGLYDMELASSQQREHSIVQAADGSDQFIGLDEG